MHQPVEVVLVVDVANVMGSRPDGWWRDRTAAASRLLETLARLVGTEVEGPGGGRLHLTDVVAVLEGRSRGAVRPASVRVVAAPADGDDVVVAESRARADAGTVPLVVTADRGLRERLPPAALVTGPAWLNTLIGR